MSNLYIWFPNSEVRRTFVIELLEIPELAPRNGTKKAKKEYERQMESLNEYLEYLEAGKTRSPYFNLYKDYYQGNIPEWELKQMVDPWDPPRVFMKGFRQLYTQDSYEHRPGKWLVIQFRNTKQAAERYDWVLERIPTEWLGRNVPLPKTYQAEQKVKWVERVLENYEYLECDLLNKLLDALKYAKIENPRLFRGKRVYLWERLAFEYQSYGNLSKAEHCLRIQATLQPGSSEAFLNLGVFLTEAGRFSDAIAAYKEGLAVTPNCEFLNYNLASLYTSMGQPLLAQRALNEAILANPERGLNHFIKGEACMENQQFEAALTYFQQALTLLEDEEWVSVKLETLLNIGAAYMHLGQLDKAVTSFSEALGLEPDCLEAHAYLASCFGRQNNQARAKWHSMKARQLRRRQWHS